ncbi:glycosyltransferase [Methanophagales archaeon]|nr:MAG: glycosyltransferase [Methanophagales archaeon]
MKILYVIHEFFPEFYTGTARVGLNLAKQMQKMGHQVKVLTYEPTETKGMFSIGGLLYKKYEYDSIQVISLRHKNLNPQVNFNIFCYDVEKEIRELIDIEGLNDIDIAHIIHPLRMGIVAKIVKEKNIPIIMTLTDYWTICPRVQLLKPNYSICNGPNEGEKCSAVCGYAKQEMKNRLKDAISLFDLADIITVPSRIVKHIFNINGFNGEKIQVVNHGLDYKYFNKLNNKTYSENDTITFGYIGPVLKHKGVHLLVEAFKKVNLSNIRLKTYGSPLHEKNYYDYLKELSTGDDRIALMGEFGYDKLSYILADIDIAVFPSICYESYCLALTECLAHKVPVIASNTVGSAFEFIKNDSGLIFNSGNIDELAQLIEKIGSKPSMINSLKDKIISPPRIEEEAMYYEIIYKKCLSKTKQNENTAELFIKKG